MAGLVPATHAVVRFMNQERPPPSAYSATARCVIAWIPATSAGMTRLAGCGILQHASA
jgi:hypothetical protein